jgi:Mn-dependent DtxR family transcriptional regulator
VEGNASIPAHCRQGYTVNEDEWRLLAALAAETENEFPDRKMPGEVAVRLGIPQKTALAMYRRWADEGLYEYDISLYSGRLTEKG